MCDSTSVGNLVICLCDHTAGVSDLCEGTRSREASVPGLVGTSAVFCAAGSMRVVPTITVIRFLIETSKDSSTLYLPTIMSGRCLDGDVFEYFVATDTDSLAVENCINEMVHLHA